MKKTIKKIIGRGLAAVATHPIGVASLDTAGYYCVPDTRYKSAHKLIDASEIPVFSELAKEVIDSQRTVLGYDRLYTLYQALGNVKRRSGVFAEVGVYKGGSSYFIASCMKNTKGWELHCFDTFEGHHENDITSEETVHKAKNFNDTSYESVKKLLNMFPQVKVYKGRFQDTAHEIKNKKFGFVHLDVDIYAPTKFSLEFFKDRLVVGGMIIVDDYGFKTCPGAKKAVDEFMKDNGNFYFMHLTSGQGLLIRVV